MRTAITAAGIAQCGGLADALARDEDQRAAGISSLFVLTGARLGEARTAMFEQFDLDLAIWTKQADYTTVKNYVREHGRRSREMFSPLAHAPGHAQADFGEAMVVIGGVEQRAHFFALDLPHSDACFVLAYVRAAQDGLRSCQ